MGAHVALPERCAPLPRVQVSCPSPKILVEKGKWAFSLGKAPSRKHCQDVSGTGLSEISGEVIYLICNYAFISCIMLRGGALALFLEMG